MILHQTRKRWERCKRLSRGFACKFTKCVSDFAIKFGRRCYSWNACNRRLLINFLRRVLWNDVSRFSRLLLFVLEVAEWRKPKLLCDVTFGSFGSLSFSIDYKHLPKLTFLFAVVLPWILFMLQYLTCLLCLQSESKRTERGAIAAQLFPYTSTTHVASDRIHSTPTPSFFFGRRYKRPVRVWKKSVSSEQYVKFQLLLHLYSHIWFPSYFRSLVGHPIYRLLFPYDGAG